MVCRRQWGADGVVDLVEDDTSESSCEPLLPFFGYPACCFMCYVLVPVYGRIWFSRCPILCRVHIVVFVCSVLITSVGTISFSRSVLLCFLCVAFWSPFREDMVFALSCCMFM